MNRHSLSILLILFFASILVSSAHASTQGEIEYLLKYGKRILIEGALASEQRWDRACLLKRKSTYVAIVQPDGANYRIIPVPGGKKIEKLCPPGIFQDAIQWYKKLHHRRE